MSSTILGTDITVYYLDENRQKRLEWTGSATGTRTINEIYSAMADLLDESATGDDATCMTAETPVEYTIGLIDANDADPWYISYECMQHVTGGALQTSGWTHANGTDTGIIIVPVTSNTITTAKYGLDISGATTGAGTLLEILVPDSGGTEYLVIRPDTNTSSFTTASQVITCDALTASQSGAVSNTGEQVWANFYNVLPVDANTHWYAYQGTVADGARTRVYDVNDGNNTDSQDYWPEGSVDRALFTNDITSATLAAIDDRNVTWFARKGNTLGDSFESTASASGGRNPIPLKPSADSNHTTGYQSITMASVISDTHAVGDVIEGGTSGAKGVITLITGSSPTWVFHYYLIGDPQITFSTAAETINSVSPGTGTGSKGIVAPANQGPALATWFTSNTAPTMVHGNTTSDIDDNGTAEGYGALLDCQSNPLSEVYEWTQYVCQNGTLGTTPTDGIAGEQYVGPTVFLEYSGTVTGTISEGSDVSQATSLATGIVVSHDVTLKQMLLRDVRGTFDTTNVVTDNDVGGTVTPNTTATAFNANTASPFGTFAGGRYFFARGIVPVNWIGADENSFETIPSNDGKKANGDAISRPTAISLSVSNLVGTGITTATDDQVWMHRLTGSGGTIDKTEYSAAGGEAAGAATLVVDTAISADTPGKSTGGQLNLRDASDNNAHYAIRFSSWATSTFTLANFAAFVTTATTNATQVTYATGGFNANVQRGDLVYNSTAGGVGYVLTVDSDTQLTLEGTGISGQTNGDTVEINCIPIALVDTADDVYVSLIGEYASSTSASVSIVYASPIFYRVKVANTRATTKIKRFVNDGSTSGTDKDTPCIRNTDSIYA